MPFRPSRPSWFDLGLAAGMAVAGFIEAATLPTDLPQWGHAAVIAAVMLGIAYRRQFPLLAVSLATAGIAVGGRVNTPFVLFAAMVVSSYTVGLVLSGRRAQLGLAIAVGLPLVGLLLDGSDPADLIAVTVLYGGAWTVGTLVHQQVARTEGYAVEVAAIRDSDTERRAQAVTEERERIARELHDIISHSISVITVQSQAIRRRMPPEQRQEIADLRAVEATARQAMAELRRLLGVLRSADERPPLTPQPGMNQLPRLVERTRSAGLSVKVDVHGEPFPLPPGLDVTAFRIIQESLTNVLKHAGTATAHVQVCYDASRLELRIEDDGRGRQVWTDGQGLVGIQERVTMYGGTFSATDRSGGGFIVAAAFPLDEDLGKP